MKRWDIDAPASSQYHEAPDGEWVEYRDVAALEARVAELEGLLLGTGLELRIRLAIAELERCICCMPGGVVDAALALLKGER